jgi:cell division septation protein DedD
VRSETYLQRLARTWTKRVAIAAAVFAAINVGIAGASLLGDGLTAPVLPPLPAPPALEAPGLALIEVPSAEPAVSVAASVPAVSAPVDAAAAASAPVSEEYLVSVGLFASRERADQLLDVLAQAGLPAMVRPIQLRRQQVQQIALGPYFSRTDAIEDLRRLKALGGYDDASVIGSRRDSSAQ